MDRGPFLAPVPGGKPKRTRQMQPVGQVFVTVLQKDAHDVAKSLRVVECAPDSFERMHQHKLSARTFTTARQSARLPAGRAAGDVSAVSIQSRRTLTLTLSPPQRERGTFGGTVS